MFVWLLAILLLGQVAYAQTGNDDMLNDTLVERAYTVGSLRFTVETYTQFVVDGERLKERSFQTIITPFGTEVDGAPDGLGCKKWESYDPKHCEVKAFVESGPDIFLVTTQRIYTYSISEDAFYVFDDLRYRVGRPLEGAEDVFLLTQQDNDPLFVGLLIGYEGVWAAMELPRQIDLNKPFRTIYRGDRIIFRFNLFQRMVCDLSTKECTLHGFKPYEEPE